MIGTNNWLALPRSSALVAIVAVVSMIGTAFVAAPSDADTSDETVLRIGFVDKVDSLNPNIGLGHSSFVLYGLVYDCLQAVGEDMTSSPNLALGWGVAEEFEPYGSVWDYNLTRNAYWHDGTPLTAHDVAFTLNLNCQYYTVMWAYQPYAYFMEYAEALDAYTVRVHFFDRGTGEPMPVAYGPSLFIPILPEHLLKEYTATYISFNWQGVFEGSDPPIVGTGPFMATSDIYDQWIEGDKLTLVKNPYYHWAKDRDETVNIDKLEIHFFDDATAMAMALEAGMIDVAKLPPQEYTALVGLIEGGAAQDIEAFDGPRCDQYWTHILINHADSGPNPSRLDPVIRQAMAMATDKEAINDNVYLGLGEPGSTLVSPVSEDWHYEPTGEELFDYDLSAAAALLEDGGYRYTPESPDVRVATSDSYAVQAGLVAEGTPLAYEMAIRQEFPEERLIAQYLQEEWGDIGISITYNLMTEATLGSLVYSHAYDTAIWCWSSDPDPNYILFCQSEAAFNGWSDNWYCNVDYEHNYLSSVRAMDVGSRQTYVHECQRIHYGDVGYIILNYAHQTYAWRTDTFYGWGDWATNPGRSIDAYWGGNPLYFDLTPFGYVPPDDSCMVKTTVSLTGAKGDNGWYVSDVTVELDTVFVVEDDEPPLTSAALSGTEGENGWFLSPVSVELSAVDDMSGVEATYFSLDGGEWQVYSSDFLMAEESIHSIKFYSVDMSGNVEAERNLTVKIDETPPTIAIDLSDGYEFNSDTAVIGLTCLDNASGVWFCMYSLDGGDYALCDEGEVMLQDLTNGTHSLYVTVYDEAGNDASDSVTFEVNATAQSMELSVDYYWYDMFAHPFGEWYDWRSFIYGMETVITDEYPYLCVWEGEPPGNTMIRTFMRQNIDAANLTEVNMLSNPEFLPFFSETARGGNALIDWHMNYITYAEAEAKLGPAAMGYFDGWYVELNGSVSLDGQAAEAVLGITSAEFDDFDSWWAVNQAAVAYDWESWLCHEAGPERLDIYWMYEYPLQFVFFYMDAQRVGDTVLISMDTISWGMEALMTRWLHEAFMPTEWYMEDMAFYAEIGPEKADLTVDAAVPSSLFAYESVADGTPCWAWEAMLQDYVLSSIPPYDNKSLFDRYWNWSGNTMFEYVNYAPGNGFYGTNLPYDHTPGAWNLSEGETLRFAWPEGEVLFFAHDPGNTTGLVDDTSQFWSNMTVEYVEPMPIDAPGSVSIDTEARLVTFTGPFDVWTWSKEQTIHEWLADEWDRLDVLPHGMPYIEFKAVNHTEPPAMSCEDRLDPLTSTALSLSAEVDHTTYRVDGGDWEIYSEPFVISGDGIHVLERYSVDLLGNVEDVRTLEVKIDMTAPELTLVTVDGAEFAGDDVNISWTCSDACSGVDRVEYRLNDGVYTTCKTDGYALLSGLADGSYTVSIRVRDEAGNSVMDELSFEVDSTSGPGLTPWSVVGIIAVAALLLALAMLLLKNRGMRPQRPRFGGEKPPGREGSASSAVESTADPKPTDADELRGPPPPRP